MELLVEAFYKDMALLQQYDDDLTPVIPPTWKEIFETTQDNTSEMRPFFDLLAYLLCRRTTEGNVSAVGVVENNLIWTQNSNMPQYSRTQLKKQNLTQPLTDTEYSRLFYDQSLQVIRNPLDLALSDKFKEWLYYQHSQRIRKQIENHKSCYERLKQTKSIKECKAFLKDWEASAEKSYDEYRILAISSLESLTEFKANTSSATLLETLIDLRKLKKMASFMKRSDQYIRCLRNPLNRKKLEQVNTFTYITAGISYQKAKTHAEMHILEYLVTNKQPTPYVIGISKDSCYLCEKVLSRFMTDTRKGHKRPYQQWVLPDFLDKKIKLHVMKEIEIEAKSLKKNQKKKKQLVHSSPPSNEDESEGYSQLKQKLLRKRKQM